MILSVPTAAPRTCRSRHARDFADLRKTADPRTEKCSLLVNLDKQPTFVNRPGAGQIAFTYEQQTGRLSTLIYPKGPDASDGTVTVTASYYPDSGELYSLGASDGETLSYGDGSAASTGYDGSLLTSTTFSGTVSGTVSWSYNNDFRVTDVTVTAGSNAGRVNFGYDTDGLLSSMSPTTDPSSGLLISRDYGSLNGLVTATSLGSISDTRSYTGFGELSDLKAVHGSTTLFEENIPDNGVGRDSLGRIQQKTETIEGVSHTYGYSHDSAGRLWQVSVDGVLAATYTYDANGNRTGGPGLSTAPVYDNQDRLLSYGKWAFAYTANGDLTTKTDTSNGQVTGFRYDGVGNLRHVDLPDGRAIDYVIDGRNRRVGKKVNGVLTRQWLYGGDPLHPIAEIEASGGMAVFGGTEYMVKGGVMYRIVKDHLGSPRLIVNATTGALVQRLDCDEWGNVTVSGTQPAGWQPFGFAGGIYDPDTGLVRFGARDYDPVVGRWTSKDPINFRGGDNLLYGYVENDPINRVDVSGLTDLNFFNPNDWVSFSWAAGVPPSSAVFTIAAHSSATGQYVQGPNGQWISPEQLADLLATWPYYQPGTTIQLYVCNAGTSTQPGTDSFAQRLADRLDVVTGEKALVYGPNGLVGPLFGGGVTILPPTGQDGGTGQWTPAWPSQ
jgi:RHS repeat-associated protein